jgi:phosphoribosylaminoimidazole-succinocarboxamide synthase
MTLRFCPQGFNEKPTPRRQQIYEGVEKILFAGPDPNTCVLYFKDQSRYTDNKTVPGKGVINNRISELLMRRLGEIGIATHYLRQLNMREQLVRATEVIPLQIEIHNVASGHLAERLGLEVGYRLPRPIIDIRFKSKELSYPLVGISHATALGWAEEDEIEDMLAASQRINDFLQGQFFAIGIRLLSFRVEFGRFYLPDFLDGCQLVLIDEISPDTCCLWDIETQTPLDPSILSKKPEIPSVYQEVARRFGVLAPENPTPLVPQ